MLVALIVQSVKRWKIQEGLQSMAEENVTPPPAVDALNAPKPEAEPRITIEEFGKVQMKVGQVLEAEKVPGSRKLMRLRVDIGTEVRQVVAGIADAYEAASLLNKKVVIVANLKPARLMGIESDGMIVAATDAGRPVLVTFTEDVPNGALLK
jgi:methionyl-tRNA synthetase